jgi:hypothetical protein
MAGGMTDGVAGRAIPCGTRGGPGRRGSGDGRAAPSSVREGRVAMLGERREAATVPFDGL